ncbi:hypothetical protein PAPYR_3990 [Paratrimastix pyriformis]|uniref:Uncharacterized protein n=1 Tax=Paratrimastix pyriformis TaxID=342808 RepID=A0ABQ8UL41_9EUKA|nr:hypothetical protein PAPYR_3990 [Paratrimastix pyriformis]
MDPVDQLVHVIFADLDRDVAQLVLNLYANNLAVTIKVLKEMGYQVVGCPPSQDRRMTPVDKLVTLFADLTSDFADAILIATEGRLDVAIKMLVEMYHGSVNLRMAEAEQELRASMGLEAGPDWLEGMRGLLRPHHVLWT